MFTHLGFSTWETMEVVLCLENNYGPMGVEYARKYAICLPYMFKFKIREYLRNTNNGEFARLHSDSSFKWSNVVWSEVQDNFLNYDR